MDFFFSNQTAATAAIAEDLHSRSDHKPLCLTRSQVPGVMLEFARKRNQWLVGFHKRCRSTMTYKSPSPSAPLLGSTVGHIQQVLESVMCEVDAERQSQTCDSMTDTQK